MLWINEIMKLLNCDNNTAWTVYNNMVLDFSECTNEQFEREAQFIYFQIVSREQEKLS
jgi:hypothetical protein